MTRNAFVFDQNRCTGCHACRLACTIENGLPLEQSWRTISTFNSGRLPDAPLFHLSLACNHCAEPACLTACPARAYTVHDTVGAVLVDDGKCIGCRYCTWACPYDAPRFDAGRGVVTKCTFCAERIESGGGPACAELCPTGALRFERLNEDEIENDAAGFPRTDLGPAIKILPWDTGRTTHDLPVAAAAQKPALQPAPSRITLRSEWSLILFTFIVSLLFGLAGAAVGGGRPVSPVLFVVIAAAGVVLSTAHLGKPLRAWRAVLNIRTSWLSREVVGFGLFSAAGLGYLWLAPPESAAGWAVLVIGAVALLSVDMVYTVAVRPGSAAPHSGGALITGVYLAAVMSGGAVLGGVLAALKLVLYLVRKAAFARAGLPARPLVSAIRIGLGLVLPVAWWAVGAGTTVWIVIAVLAGELVDRAEYYAELEIASPERQMALDLAAGAYRL